MGLKLNANCKDDILTIEGNGEIKNSYHHKDCLEEFCNMIISSGCGKILFDITDTSFSTNMMEQLINFDMFRNKFPKNMRGLKLVLIISPKDHDRFNFWEDYNNNRGYYWKIFTDYEKGRFFLETD